ncbi:MAG: ribose 5-phosphate isomerase B [Planctomycetes bacterium]|jgi:ribose 5-phosphate isomerase B|nr:ribose 5-phosphate isomerase B [Phycisphaerae bacterium]NBB96192.1 ribose 5-phosphate isomerase B [Planctomycetota bacterium]
MKIGIGSDHAGFKYRNVIRDHLIEAGHDVMDFGPETDGRCDYPDLIFPVARAVAAGEVERGIALGGSGNGEAMAANRVKGCRCGLAWDLRSARLMREHNDANCLALGQRMVSIEAALEIVALFLATPFEGGRHEHRIRKLDDLA